jgi:glutathione S-transferase
MVTQSLEDEVNEATQHCSFGWAELNGNRYLLNLKNLPYETVYVEYPDLEATFKKIGIPPGGTTPSGSPLYTSPAIVDSSTGAMVADSYKIAEYLDKAYPTTPKVIPPGTEALQAMFYDQLNQMMFPSLVPLFPKLPRLLNPRSAEYIDRTRSEWFGMPLEQLAPVGEAKVQEWNKLREVFNSVEGWLNKSSGPFVMGDTVTFADIVIASFLQGLKLLFGENSEEWKDIASWSGGRWVQFLKDMDKYANVDK